MKKLLGKSWTIWLKIAGLHRSDDETGRGGYVNFFFPKMSRGFFIRLGIVSALALMVFLFVLMPCRIHGGSMMPTYPERGFTFCYKLRYLFSRPKRGDVVIIRYRDNTFFLKRIVGVPGDTIEFRNGELFRNQERVNEPYLRYVSDWNLSPRQVEPGHYYVVGDNRSQRITEHVFGSVRSDRIVGSPIW
ncbi:MAG: signal peptidase I [Victivallales bacterium]|jgi:signal peptidase I|nr:signal peptidase I [Victivallales bacterium]